MAKSARASGIKKNKAALKRRVFLPAETARNDRLSAKLLELAKAPKPAKQEMDLDAEEEAAEPSAAKEDETATEDAAAMDIDGKTTTTKIPKSKRELQRRRAERIDKQRHRRPRNQVTFSTRPKKRRGGK